MSTGHYYQSDEEIIRRLQVILHEQGDGPRIVYAARAGSGRCGTSRSELAERIYREPDVWGIDEIPVEYRTDAAADALLQMLSRVSTMGSPPEHPGMVCERGGGPLQGALERQRTRKPGHGRARRQPRAFQAGGGGERGRGASSVFEGECGAVAALRGRVPPGRLRSAPALPVEPDSRRDGGDAGRAERPGDHDTLEPRQGAFPHVLRAGRIEPAGDRGDTGAVRRGAVFVTQRPTTTFRSGKGPWVRFAMGAGERAGSASPDG